jgi:metal-responsive CopG/Arc/MetJ family transcriptional regulator
MDNMNKEKENNDHLLNIRVPQTMFDKFKDKCSENYKTMSEALRDLIQEYIKRKQ